MPFPGSVTETHGENMMSEETLLSEDSVREMLSVAGAKVMSRGGRSEHYGAPREFSFEVKGVFANGLGLHVLARQYIYRDPWEAAGRVNDTVDVLLIREGKPSELPRGNTFFQGRDEEAGVDHSGLEAIIRVVSTLNPKLFALQKLTGDLP